MKNLFPQSITHQRKPFLLADTDIVFKRHIWSYQINILNIVLKGESNRNVWLIRTCDSLWVCILFLFVDKIPRKKKKTMLPIISLQVVYAVFNCTSSAAAALRKKQQSPRQTHITLESSTYLEQRFYKQ